jgi:sec-independent protein translocase protein TatA
MLAAGPFGFGLPELLIILAVLVLVFGVSKIGDLGGALGKSVREFRKASKNDDDAPAASTKSDSSNSAAATPQASNARSCSNCSAQLGDDEKFCAKCGAPVQAAVN